MALFEILQRPSIGDVLIELTMFVAPIWIAVFVGVLVGWAWKPQWANFGRGHHFPPKNPSASSLSSSSSSSSSSSHINLQRFPTASAFIPSLISLKSLLPSYISCISDNGLEKDTPSLTSISDSDSDCSSSHLEKEKSAIVTRNDLERLSLLVEEKDGGPAWIPMMDQSTPSLSYQAWRRDPKVGPPQYRSRTIYEDATPEMVRDFFWDDEFRLKWDDMLIHAETLEECPTTGAMVVQWVRKFPFFCSDREYIIGRRIWESSGSYYCVTKGVPCSSVQRRNKPRRVDLYYSSWYIRAVESKRGDGRRSACEVVLFHHEDMGIPWEIAKLGVRQGMWGAVKKVDAGFRSYQIERASSGAPLSRCASMAQINTKVGYLIKTSDKTKDNSSSDAETKEEDYSMSECDEKGVGRRNMAQLLVVGGAVVLACGLDRGLLTKTVIFGVARRFANIGKRL